MINRIEPAGPVDAYVTYSFAQRPDLLVRTACEEAGCVAWLGGWQSLIDEATELGRNQAHYIRYGSGRTFTEQRTGDGITVFAFDSKQRCFADHKTNPQAFSVRSGDWRGNPDGWSRMHERPADWVEDFGEHQQKIAADQARG